LFGRSMGSGPTTYVSSVRSPYALILMSGYTSIQNAAKSILGWASILGFIIYEKFRNIDVIKNAKCPVLIVHGKKDNLIPVQHSMDLFENCNQPCYLFIPLKMDHNEFQIEEDLCQPIKAFIRKIEERIAVQ
jgi:abhydrolase domain-containing protein 17